MTRRNDPCPCGSGRRYKQCCGRSSAPPGSPAAAATGEVRAGASPTAAAPAGDPAPRRLSEVPGDVLVVENFLAAGECARLVALARTLPTETGRMVADDGRLLPAADAAQAGGSDGPRRITTLIKTFEKGDAFVPVVGHAFLQWVRGAYGQELEWFEWPDVLCYGPGGRYDPHADSENLDPATGEWRRVLERDFSLLVYLNDDYVGGDLEFPEIGYRLRPRRGMLVAFPSDHRYLHAALPVESGTRFVIVSWAAAVGSPRLQTGSRRGIVYTDRKYDPALR